jgi:hypothetical protein
VHFIVSANKHGGVLEEDGAENVAQQNGGSTAQITGPRESGSPESDNIKTSEETQSIRRICQLLAIHPDFKQRTKPRHQKTFFVLQKKIQLEGEENKCQRSEIITIQGTSR